MSKQNYWARSLLSRRAALRGAATLGAGAATLSLIGCGGDDNAPRATNEAPVVDSTQGKPGGTFRLTVEGYPANFDSIQTSISYGPNGFVHGALLGHAYGTESKDPRDYYAFEPEVAQSLPEQVDETTFTFKIRPNNKFTNGRAITSEDVRYTFDRLVNAT